MTLTVTLFVGQQNYDDQAESNKDPLVFILVIFFFYPSGLFQKEHKFILFAKHIILICRTKFTFQKQSFHTIFCQLRT